MTTTLLQATFGAGEVSPNLHGRVDQQLYNRGAKTCRNFIVRQFGGAENRTGFRFIAECGNPTGPVRIIPFQFNTEQTYVVELSHTMMRFYSNGARVELGGSPVELVTPWGYTQTADIGYTQSADVMTLCHKEVKPYQLRRLSSASFELVAATTVNGPFAASNTNNASNFWVETSGEAYVGKIVDIRMYSSNSSTYITVDDIGGLIRVGEETPQSKPWVAGILYAVGDRVRSDGKNYSATTLGTSGVVQPTHDFGVVSDGTVSWRFDDYGYGVIRIDSMTSGTVMSKIPQKLICTFAFPGASVTSITKANPAVVTTGSSHGIAEGELFIFENVPGMTQMSYGVYRARNVTSTTLEVTRTDYSNVDSTSYDTYTSGAFARRVAQGEPSTQFAFGAFSGRNGYPDCVNYFSDRLIYASTESQTQTMWMSKTSVYDDFGTSAPLQDDDAINATLNARQVNEIRALVGLSKLVILTSGAEWVLTEGRDEVLTPSTVGVKTQSYRGCSRIQPAVVGDVAIYVQSDGRTIRDLSYKLDTNSFTGSELSLLSGHLFEGKQVVDMCYAQYPNSVVWIVLDDGSLLSMTYLAEQQVLAWARHDTGTAAGDKFESCCVVKEDEIDALYVVVSRNIGGTYKRYIERLEERDYTSVTDALFMDSALTYNGTNTTINSMTLTGGTNWTVNETLTLASGTAAFAATDVGNWIILYNAAGDEVRLNIISYTSTTQVSVKPLKTVPAALRSTSLLTWRFARKVMGGLTHLEGRTVSILNDGNVELQKTVSGGLVTLERPGWKVSIGLPITADLQTLPFNVGGAVLRNRAKVAPRVAVQILESRGLFAGKDENNLTEYKQREFENYLDPTALKTGIAKIDILTDWNEDSTLFIRQADPLPLSVIGVMTEVGIGNV